MPKFVGCKISGAKRIGDNAVISHSEKADRAADESSEYLHGDVYCRLSYAQARKLPAEQVLCSLDTTDKGSRNTFAKRWYRWFAQKSDVMYAEGATDNMLRKAGAQNIAALRAFELT